MINYEELLHEYFDDGLDEQREEMLFAALSHDTGLRREFSDFMQLRNVARNEAATALPPAGLTAAVFSGLGYRLDPSHDTTPAPVVEAPRSSAGRTVSVWPYIATSVLSSLLTAIVVVLLLRPSEERPSADQIKSVSQLQPENAASSVHSSSMPTGSAQSASGGHQAPVVSSADADMERIRSIRRNTFLSGRTDIHSADLSSADEAENTAIADAEENIFITNAATATPEQNTLFASRTTDYEPLRSRNVSSLFFPDEPDRFDIALRSSAMLSFPSVDVATQSQGAMAPIAVSALYLFSEEHAAGVEFGREAFAQEYRRVIHGDLATVRQNPTLWWWTASYRYMPELLRWEELSPFAQLSIGGVQVGPFTRLKFGVNWEPFMNIALTAGAEGSALLYPVEGANFTTTKLGIFYGVNVRL